MFARIAEKPPADWRRRGYLALIGLAVVAVLAVRIAAIATECAPAVNIGLRISSTTLSARKSRSTGSRGQPSSATIHSSAVICGCIFRKHMWCAITIPRSFRPISTIGPCVLIWEATYQSGLTPRFKDWLKANGLLDRLDWAMCSMWICQSRFLAPVCGVLE